MVITRRRFLGTLVRSAAGLLVADDALELLVEPRRFWPGADFAPLSEHGTSTIAVTPAQIYLRRAIANFIAARGVGGILP